MFYVSAVKKLKVPDSGPLLKASNPKRHLSGGGAGHRGVVAWAGEGRTESGELMGMKYKGLLSPVVSKLGLFKLGNAPPPRPHHPHAICLQCKRPGFNPWVKKIPWRRKWQPTPVFLRESSMDRGAWGLQSMGLQRVGHK